MMNQKVVAGICCVVVLALSGCSRQQSDWQKTRESNTTESYEQFLKKYPSGEFTAQAQARVKELYEERDWQKARDADTPEAYQAFLKQYPEGKWTEEARIRVENFTLAQAPSGSVAPATAATEPADASQIAAVNAPPSGGVAAVPGKPAGAAAKAPAATAAAGGPPPPVTAAHGGAASNVKSAPAHVVAKSSKAAAGNYGVQLGAFKSGAGAAHARWAHLQKEFPSALGGLSSKVLTKQTASGSLYRLQAIGLTEKHARSVCSALAAKAQPCLVVAPEHG